MIWQLLLNLPGWRWATITKVALDRLSRSLHSDVCDSDGCRDAVVHSRISGRGNRRFRAVPNYFNTTVTVRYEKPIPQETPEKTIPQETPAQHSTGKPIPQETPPWLEKPIHTKRQQTPQETPNGLETA